MLKDGSTMAYHGILQMFRGVPLNIGNEDTLYFGSNGDQNTYFDSFADTRLTFSDNDYKFIRESRGYVKVNASHDFLENCNYLRYKNEDLSGEQTQRKWYYAFVTGLEYISDQVTGVHFAIDVLQTWLPNIDYDLNECFVERNHVTSDEIGENVVTETIRAYKNKTYNERLFNIMLKNNEEMFYICVLFNVQTAFGEDFLRKPDIDIIETTDFTHNPPITYSANFGSNKLDGTVCGSFLALFPVTYGNSGALNEDGLSDLRKAIKKVGTITDNYFIDVDSISDIYMLPACLIDEKKLVGIRVTTPGSVTVWEALTLATRWKYEDSGSWHDLRTTAITVSFDPQFNINTIGTYTPKNKKLLTSQYMNYAVVNTEGNTAIYEPEGITEQGETSDHVVAPIFTIFSSVLPPFNAVLDCLSGGAGDHYYGATQINEQLFRIGELPKVSLNVPTYTQWLTAQVTQRLQQVAPVALSAVAGSPLPEMAEAGATGTSLITNPKFEVSQELRKGSPFQGYHYGNSKASDLGQIKEDWRKTEKSAIRTAWDIFSSERPTPISAGNGISSGNALIAHQIFQLSARKVAPIEPELTRIDNYFTAYGYAINAIQKPHVKIRTRYTYIKTRGARNTPRYDTSIALGGNKYGIPAEYMEQINDLYDQGIRFWKIQDLSLLIDSQQDNTILPSNQWDN